MSKLAKAVRVPTGALGGGHLKATLALLFAVTTLTVGCRPHLEACPVPRLVLDVGRRAT
jgi:hypothetical protein